MATESQRRWVGPYQPPRIFVESHYRNGLASYLRSGGWMVRSEVTNGRRRGRVDLIAVLPGREVRAIEVKVVNPLGGLGQALAYGREHGAIPTLAVPSELASRSLKADAGQAGVDLWELRISPAGLVTSIQEWTCLCPMEVAEKAEAVEMLLPLRLWP
jgi:hypothetical protein